MADQDDLLLLHHLRAHASGDSSRREASQNALAEEPGRAAGRVASWAMGRALSYLQCAGRRGFEPGQGLAPSAQEARLLRIVRSLAAYDRRSAEEEARWLVRGTDIEAFLDRLAPLASFYPQIAAAPARRCAAQA